MQNKFSNIFSVVNFVQIFVTSRSTEIQIELNFIGAYVLNKSKKDLYPMSFNFFSKNNKNYSKIFYNYETHVELQKAWRPYHRAESSV